MTHSIALVNITDGTVQGHKAGCADLKRDNLRKHADDVWTLDVESKHQAWDAYNSDFINECEHEDCDVDAGQCCNAYDIQWSPCAKHVPGFAEAAAPVVEVKRGPKWTYIFVDGEQVMEVRSHLADQVLATVNFG